jgi:hypothetical protein
VRLREPWLRAARLAGQPGRRPPLGRRPGGQDAAHGRAGQEPAQRGHVVARQRERHRAQPGRDGRLGAGARPVAATALRGRLVVRGRGRLQPHVRDPRRGRRNRPPRGAAPGRPRAGRPPPGYAVPPLRVRPRHGQRTRRPLGVPGAVRAPSPLPGGLRLGVDRPRPARPHPRWPRVLRLRR